MYFIDATHEFHIGPRERGEGRERSQSTTLVHAVSGINIRTLDMKVQCSTVYELLSLAVKPLVPKLPPDYLST